MSEKIFDNSVVGKRSLQNLSCNWTGSADFGRLVPFDWIEMLGTDKVVRCRPKIEMQMLPLASPTFGKMDLYVHYFFVPSRLLMEGNRDFLRGEGAYASSFSPYWLEADFKQVYNNLVTDAGIRRSLFKHWTSMGLPPFFVGDNANSSSQEPITLLPFRAYNQIWWDFYRDPELLRDESKQLYTNNDAGRQVTALSSMRYYPRYRNIKDTWIAELFSQNGTILAPSVGDVYNYSSTDSIDSNTETALKVRQIEALTRFAERMSLSGKRTIDQLFARYGISPEWDRLEMAQYVGGGKSTVLISDITSTADTTLHTNTLDGTPLGAKAGQGYSFLSDVNIEFEAHEPGILMGIFSVMPHVHFVQGIGRQWRRKYREDFFTKHLEHVGQVAVPKCEIGKRYGIGADNAGPAYINSDDGKTFAFTEPYYDYKRGVDVLAGDFMYYHRKDFDPSAVESDSRDVQYMQSMEMFIDYPTNRSYDPENVQIRPLDFNKVFFYLGGNNWQDVDDHLHLSIDKDILLNRPMDGYAVPTLETTEDPHREKTVLKQSVEL